MTETLAVAFVVIGVGLGAVGSIIAKRGNPAKEDRIRTAEENILLTAGALLFGAGVILTYAGLVRLGVL